jgi:hypothetical protein
MPFFGSLEVVQLVTSAQRPRSMLAEQMRTLTPKEIKDWCIGQGIELDDRGVPIHPHSGSSAVRCGLPNITKLTWFCRFIERSLQPREHCLLWVTTSGVWPSSENWHLYYRLRQSHGDQRLIHEAPGHLFLEFEAADLVSFVEVGLIAGWDMHLIPTIGYGRVFVSHDEWVEFAMDDPSETEKIKSELGNADLTFQLMT